MRWTLLILIFAVGCTKKPEPVQDPVARGRSLYMMHCASCHNANPKVDGLVGPAVFGSSLELLEAKLLRGQYPEGYTPKRTTRQMAVLPFLKDQIPALHAYLNSP